MSWVGAGAASRVDWWHLSEAVATLRAGGVIAQATEGVWGLACDPDDRHAVARILALKGRDVARGLILLGHHSQVFAAELAQLSEIDRARAHAEWPGPSTFVVPNRTSLPWPHWITGDHPGVAVRVPGHEQARLVCASFGGPLVSTSANPSGRRAPTTMLKVRAYFGSEVDYYLPGEVLEPGTPSRIHDFATGKSLRGTLNTSPASRHSL